MPIIKSAKKRVRVATKAAIRNSKVKRSLRTSLKAFGASHKSEDARKAQSDLDRAVKKGIIHKNKAARKKKQLSAQDKAAGTKAPIKKATPKTAAKKAPVKKTVVKKAPIKKTAAKKPAAKK
jgi:small subunit ribosomal protein S20